MLLQFNPQGVRTLLVKLSTADRASSIEFIKGIWNEFAVEKTFEYTFLSDLTDELYSEDSRFRKILMLFCNLIKMHLGPFYHLPDYRHQT